MKTHSPLGRREFLRRFSAAGALGLSAGTVLSACGGGDTSTQTPAASDQPASGAASTSCDDVSGLSEQEVAMRTQLQYVDVAPSAEKHCTNCALFIAAAGGAACGGCNLIKGPIAPNGYCISWAPKQT